CIFFFFQAEDGIRDFHVTGVQTCALPIYATPEQAGEAHAHIRSRLRAWFGGAAADGCHILYGGSVKPDNVRALAAQPDVDGALVGGASLDPAVFFEIVQGSAPAGS